MEQRARRHLDAIRVQQQACCLIVLRRRWIDSTLLEVPSVQSMIMLMDWMRLHEPVISGTCASSRHFAMEFRMEFRDLLLPSLAASPALSSRSLESATIACAEWNARCSFSILSLLPCKAASAAACEGDICTLRRTDSRRFPLPPRSLYVALRSHLLVQS